MIRTTQSDLDRGRGSVERGTRSRPEASLTSLHGGVSVGTPWHPEEDMEEEVLSLRYVSPSISQTTTEGFLKNKMKDKIIRKCFVVIFFDYVSAYICITAIQYYLLERK